MLRTAARAREILRRTALLTTAAALVAAPATIPSAQAADEPVEDLSPPTLTLTRNPQPTVHGWHGTAVTVTVKASDNKYPSDTGVAFLEYTLTGATTGTARLDPRTGGTVTISNAGTTVLTALAIDGNGNEAPGGLEIKIDTAAPTVAIESPPASETPVAVGTDLKASFTCADVGSGVASCAGTIANGATLDTGTPGRHSFTVTATDRAGLVTQVARTYEVYGTFHVAAPPSTGAETARVGDLLRATPGTYTPTPDSVTCTWLRDSSPIPGETEPFYTVTAADHYATLSYECTASREFHHDLTVTSAGTPIFSGQLPDDLVTAASLTGEGVVGGTLVAAFARQDMYDTVRLQWRRDGLLLPDSKRSYVISAADRGHTISASVVVERPGFTTREYAIGAVAVTKGRPLAADGPVRVTGTPTVGQRLSATAPGVRPADAATTDPYSSVVEWLRDGAVVGSGPTYDLTAADAGRHISARVVATGAAYETLVVTGDALTVGKATPTLALKAKAQRSRKVRLTLTASAPGTAVDGSVVVRRGAKVVARGTIRNGTLRLVLKKQKPGRVAYVATYAGSQAVAAGKASAKVRVRP